MPGSRRPSKSRSRSQSVVSASAEEGYTSRRMESSSPQTPLEEDNSSSSDHLPIFKTEDDAGFAFAKEGRELARTRRECERETGLLRLVLAIATIVFPICLPHQWHLTGASSVSAFVEIERRRLQWGQWLPDLAPPSLLEFC
ncbi:unnamed protein product, partial [Amoebophrya sp. A25]|eukprot:GSA25T00006835001.1